MTKTVLITGSSTGIGRASALLFHQKGWQVAASMRTPEREQELAKMDRMFCPRLDVTDEASIARAVEETIARFGGIDVLVNNAGYSVFGPFEAAGIDQVQRQFDVNLFGMMHVTRALLPHFRERRSGVIVNVSSIAGRMTFPYMSLYHASKWAVDGFSESLAFELGSLGIRVKIVAPGPVRTDFYGRSMDMAEGEHAQAYQPAYGKTVETMKRFGKHGYRPERTARAIYRAATRRSRKMHYAGDPMAAALLLARKILPARLFLAMVRWGSPR
jgi:NAD(P)-dependent dehydrogenase (short-subunit alcohol dehydrogenase family)